MSFLILAQSEVTARALGAWLELLGEKAPPPGDAACLVIDVHGGSGPQGMDAYYQAVSWIEAAIAQQAAARHRGMVVLVDTVRLSYLNAISQGWQWDDLIALLMLTFPDVKWVFGVPMGDSGSVELTDHKLPVLFDPAWRDPLFDPTGLRELVREVTNDALSAAHKDQPGDPMQLPRRERLAAALDDEQDFATIHGFAAYRYGFRAELITSWALMDRQFGKKRAKNATKHGYALLFEDMRLSYPDKPGGYHLSSLDERAAHCPLLKAESDTSAWRFLITSGQTGVDEELMEENEAFLERKAIGTGRVLLKPIGGVCDLWKRAGLLKELSEDQFDNPRGNAPGFVWPPTADGPERYDGHAAAGKLGMVAAVLIKRARAAKARAAGASDFLLAATLASEAAELLGGKTQDISLTALQIKHECEVRAECMFIGTGFHFELKQRFREIKSEVASVTQWAKMRRKKSLDARAAIIKELREVYSEAGQMEEEDRCLVEFRRLNRKMSRPNRWWEHLLIVPWLAHGILAYGEWVMSGFSKLLCMVFLWVVLFVGLHQWASPPDGGEKAAPAARASHVHPTALPAGGTDTAPAIPTPPVVRPSNPPDGGQTVGVIPPVDSDTRSANASEAQDWTKNTRGSLGEVVSLFFGSGPDDDKGMLPLLISCFAVFFGVFHIGILMSYLYSLISRK